MAHNGVTNYSWSHMDLNIGFFRMIQHYQVQNNRKGGKQWVTQRPLQKLEHHEHHLFFPVSQIWDYGKCLICDLNTPYCKYCNILTHLFLELQASVIAIKIKTKILKYFTLHTELWDAPCGQNMETCALCMVKDGRLWVKNCSIICPQTDKYHSRCLILCDTYSHRRLYRSTCSGALNRSWRLCQYWVKKDDRIGLSLQVCSLQ